MKNSQEIDYVKKGLRNVYVGSQGSARGQFANTPYTAAGKTGTAEVVYFGPLREYYGTEVKSYSHVGFAPYENPEIAYAVIIPWASTNYSVSHPHANNIARRSLDKYFELKAKYETTKVSESNVEQPILPAITEEKIGEDEQE